MNVWLRTLRFMYTRYSCSGKDDDGYFLGDRRLSIVGEEARVWFVEGIIAVVGIIDGEGCVFGIQSCGCNGYRRPRRGEAVCDDGQGKQGYIVFLGQAYGGRRGAESRSESAMERCERYAEVYGVVFHGRLDGVAFKDRVLSHQVSRARCRGWDVRLTMARTLDRCQAIFHGR